MRTIRTKVYKFEELTDKAKEKALDTCRYYSVDNDWWDSLYEDAANIGLKITGFEIDRGRYASGEFILSAAEVAANIFRDHGAMCETYKTAENFMAEWQPLFDDYMNEESASYEDDNDLIVCEEEFLKSLLEDYSIMLQNEYEYLTEDEAVQEMIEANDYEFTQEGNRF